MSVVLLLKARSASCAAYVEEVESVLGSRDRKETRVVCVSPYEFVYDSPDVDSALVAAAQLRQAYRGLLVTSPRSVEALRVHKVDLTLGLDDAVDASSWPVFTVGKGTQQALQEYVGDGLQVVTPAGVVDAKGLAAAVVKVHSSDDEAQALPWLILTGSTRRDTLTALLGEAGVPFEELVVYESRPNPTLREDVLEALDGRVPTVVGFFSPLGVEAAVAQLTDLWPGDVDVPAVAIGRTTLSVLHKWPYSKREAVVAAKPNPQAFAEAVENVL